MHLTSIIYIEKICDFRILYLDSYVVNYKMFMKRVFIVFFTLIVVHASGQGEVYVLTSGDILNIENLDGPEGQMSIPKGTYCAAANKNNLIFEQVADSQTETMWCWAACIKMVLNYQGIHTTQEEIVERTFGRIINQGANCIEIANTADGWQGGGVEIKSWYDSNLSVSDAIESLAYHYPLIVGMDIPNQDINHAYVLSAVYFKRDSNGKKIPLAVSLRDPWPYNKSLTHLSWTDFERRLQCVVHVEPK